MQFIREMPWWFWRLVALIWISGGYLGYELGKLLPPPH